MVKDPVCGMEFDEKTAKVQFQHRGKAYYFCSVPCKISFSKEPEKYVKEP